MRVGLSLPAQVLPMASPQRAAQASADVEREREPAPVDTGFDVLAAKAIFADNYAIGEAGDADTA